MVPTNCWSVCLAEEKSNACCCATALGEASVSAVKSVVRWDAFSAPADWTVWIENLTRGEILEQMLRLQHRLDPDERLSHIVMMGMGEPLANLNNVLGALEVAKDSAGLGISPRRITISTVGLPSAIDRLASSGIPYNLAVQPARAERRAAQQARAGQSEDRHRHGTRGGGTATSSPAVDGSRSNTCYWAASTIRTTMRESWPTLLRPRNVLLNVIPYNPVAGLPYKTPSKKSIENFREVLESAGVNIKFRQRKGSEIDAACGQLRRNRKANARL